MAPKTKPPVHIARARRIGDPRKILADGTLVDRIDAQLEGAPWDVFSAPEVAAVLSQDLNPMSLNDWEYQRTPGRPRREPSGAWRGNVGYYRKDGLVMWARTGGLWTLCESLWPLSASYIAESLSFPQPGTLAATRELLNWLLENHLVQLRARPRAKFVAFPGPLSSLG